MDTPVEIRGWKFDGDRRSETVIAKGPFIIMAHGLLALAPAARSHCWIASPAGNISAAQVANVLREWSGKAA